MGEAHRWQDAAERDARNKDAAQRERQALVAADLADARAIQAASRVQARAAQVTQAAQGCSGCLGWAVCGHQLISWMAVPVLGTAIGTAVCTVAGFATRNGS